MKHVVRLLSATALTIFAFAAFGPTSSFAAANDPFTFLASGFTQSLYATGLQCCGGVAFAPDTDPLFVSFGDIYRADAQTTTTMNGSTIHPVTVTSPGSNLFFGVVNAQNGAIYANTSGGVEEIDAAGNILAGPFGPPGNGLGITVDPETGNLVYPDEFGNISWVNEALTSSGTLVFGASSDGLIFDPTGNYLFTAEFGAGVDEYNRAGLLVQNISNGGSPDGMAFHAGTPNFLVSNNNDGSITRYDFPNGDLTQSPAQSVFASGGFRGDLTQVGSDGCLYVTQGGTRFADGTVTGDGSLVQICPGFVPPSGGGSEKCGAALCAISISDAKQAEGSGGGTTTMNFKLMLTTKSTGPQTVTYATSDGTATGGAACGGTASAVDYISSAGTITIPAGATKATIPITVCADNVKEADETFYVTLTGTSSGSHIVGKNPAQGTIVNDDK